MKVNSKTINRESNMEAFEKSMMSSIKLNSELPLDMMEQHETEWNDYEFILYHLYISNPKYKRIVNKIRKEHPERLMILDNSAYEFFVKGEELNLEDYAKVVNELKPDVFILPDVLMDKNKTLKGVKEFLIKYKTLSEPMAVIQGNSAEEMLECLDEYKKLGITYVGVPFHNSFFKNDIKVYQDDLDVKVLLLPTNGLGRFTEDMTYALGRVKFLEENFEKFDKLKVHILGTHFPFEVVFYNEFQTMDSAYPVKLAYEGCLMGFENKKPNIIIDDFLENKTDKSMELLMEQNISTFHKYANLGVKSKYVEIINELKNRNDNTEN